MTTPFPPADEFHSDCTQISVTDVRDKGPPRREHVFTLALGSPCTLNEQPVDPFAESVGRYWHGEMVGSPRAASDLRPFTPDLPIRQHDIATGWPDGGRRGKRIAHLEGQLARIGKQAQGPTEK